MFIFLSSLVANSFVFFCFCGLFLGVGVAFSQSAKVIYLKDWDTQRNSLPDGRFVILINICIWYLLTQNTVLIVVVFSNVERLRDFIKHVYVDRRYTGERSLEKPPRGKMVPILSCSSSILNFVIAHCAPYRRRISVMSSLSISPCSKLARLLVERIPSYKIFNICRLKLRT